MGTHLLSVYVEPIVECYRLLRLEWLNLKVVLHDNGVHVVEGIC